jgi:outer membrane protein
MERLSMMLIDIDARKTFKTFGFALFAMLIGPSAFGAETVVIAPDGNGALELKAAMEMAYQHSFSRQAAEQDSLASKARQSVLSGSKGPRLSVEASRGWIDTDVNKLAGKTLPTGQRYPDEINAVSVVVAQPITQLFATQSRLNAEQKIEEASQSQVIAEGTDARLQGAEAYIAVLKAIRFLAISKESRDLINRQKQDANLLKESGKLSTLDYSRFELAVSESNTQVSDAEAQLQVASDNLHEVLGVPTEQTLQLADLKGSVETTAGQAQERAELVGASRRVEALENQMKAQKVEYWPQVSAFARYSRDFAAEDVRVNFLGLNVNIPKEDFRDQLSYGFNLQWDIWDWGTRSGRAAEIGTQVSKARIQHDALASRLRLESSRADAEWNRANQILKDAQIADKLSESILRSFDTKFRNGLATTTDLLSVQRDRIRAQAQLANATYNLQGALLRKQRAEGTAL